MPTLQANQTTATEIYHSILAEFVALAEQTDSARSDRTGTGTYSVFGRQYTYDLSDWTVPLLTTKRIHLRSLIAELLWILQGRTNVKDLQAVNVTIWDEWAKDNGELGPVYGHQWRGLGVDQVATVVQELKRNPYSRRLLVSAWNVEQLSEMALLPCHVLWQLYVENDGRLSLQFYQRSADLFLGLPFNIASYSLLLFLICKLVDREPARLVHSLGDLHLYSNHVEAAKTQLARVPKPSPRVQVDPMFTNLVDLNSYGLDGIHVMAESALFMLKDPYLSDPSIRAEVAV
jgi:thymidylate synthase